VKVNLLWLVYVIVHICNPATHTHIYSLSTAADNTAWHTELNLMLYNKNEKELFSIVYSHIKESEGINGAGLFVCKNDYLVVVWKRPILCTMHTQTLYV
jgi:hypothetical protein